MLHAPTSEAKTDTTGGKTHVAAKPEQEFHPQLFGAAVPHMLASAMPNSSPYAQHRQTVAGLQTTHGNQAVLHMLRSPQRIARKPAIRPSQGILLQRKCACGGSSESEGECAECKARREGTLKRSATNQVAPSAVTAVPPIVYDVLRSHGQPLDASTRAFMEPRFGHDFSQVRVHTDAGAAESARAVNALAYTVGRNVVFGVGQYTPGTTEGKRLMAHELTHVVQQKGVTAFQGKLALGSPTDRFEQEADTFANQIMSNKGGSVKSASVLAPGEIVQRDLIFAGGYANPNKNDQAEIDAANRKEWSPSSTDFKATATNSGGGSGAATFQGLLSSIASKSPNSITDLGLIGHADSGRFGLSGTISSHGSVTFTMPGMIDSATISQNMSTIVNVRNRFAANAKITLFGCDAGTSQGFLDNLSNAFQVCVRGFTREILWCFLFSGKTISSRGRVFIDTAGLFAINLLGCSEFLEDVKKLQPDTESCKGVVAAPVPIPKGSELNTDSDNALAEVESVDNTENQLVGSDDAATDVG